MGSDQASAEMQHSPPEELVGKWVNLTRDDGMAVLAELDVSGDTINEVMNNARKATLETSVDDGPFDLLWKGSEEFLILPRTRWRERHTLRGDP